MFKYQGFCAPCPSQKTNGAENLGLSNQWCADLLKYQGSCAPCPSQKANGAENLGLSIQWCAKPSATAASSESPIPRRGARPPGPGRRLAVTLLTKESLPSSAVKLAVQHKQCNSKASTAPTSPGRGPMIERFRKRSQETHDEREKSSGNM